MLQPYASNEFYADLVVYRLEKLAKAINTALFYLFAFAFIVVFVGLIWRQELMNGYLNRFENEVGPWLHLEEPFRLLVGVLLFWTLLPFIPTVIHVIRKQWLYPKASLSQQAFAVVQSKELVIHPRWRNSNGHPKSFYVKVLHPTSGNLIPVDVEENWYQQLTPGDRVHAYYHPGGGNILYLKKG
ncbi:hypothetical protein [Dyadobacter sp. MSC1_007]|jgi:hypothetical protein|uniref:hypothetical protein n=1 Tax=Dyadobacter sp. MSC1_007 TaxID=2909264 RepID=UPI00202DBA39|nr:hypothetical protein [Dyadobacter sp. MSC1_007]